MSKPMTRLYNLRPFKELRIKAEEATFENMKTSANWPTVMLISTSTDNFERQRRLNQDKIALNTVECFGRELVPNQEYPIRPGSHLAFFSWGGCTLQVKGNLAQEYESINNSMKEYLNFAWILENRRQLAALRKTIGPRILVVGANSSGKSSICSILCNYALKMSWNPTFVELDPRSSTDKDFLQFLPGMIGCCIMDIHHDKEPAQPLYFHYGRTDIQEETKLFTDLCESLSSAIYLRFLNNLKETQGLIQKDGYQENDSKLLAASGIIINGPNLANLNLIKEIVEIFNINIVVVVDDPSLKHNLTEIYHKNTIDDSTSSPLNESSYPVTIIGLSKSDGAVAVDNNRIRFLKRLHWKYYFQGSIQAPIKPQNLRILYSEYTFLVYETPSSLPISALPVDYISHTKETHITKWQGSPRKLLNAILSLAATDDIDLVSKTNIACILHVRSVENISSDQQGDLSKGETDDNYVLELWCPEIVSGKLFSRLILVPTDLNQLKWQADSF